ncbi:DNA ligase D [Bordetella sp. 02P26C-1]|uniref:DNA ligase D n=1 Tax=Bordetella sp. 02P26C-1 TaxID=2683195 RepID=UPI001353D626|nr:DNA ligase D [Bordetella sp. 02P26C-1]MVW79871.1 DNA ligase D [Bordetella sp. 02P26C-1]
MVDSLKKYREKRNFAVTPEPAEGGEANEDQRAFVIQKHWARRLHYDFRLELDGAMKSWAVPKGPSYDPSVKRMAVQVEDHPIAYNKFEGTIPKGEYGAGEVIIWDEGSWVPVGDPHQGYRDGHLKLDMHGSKMQGRWALVRMKTKRDERQPPWLLIKDRDEFARDAADFSVVDELPDSVVPLRKKKSTEAAQRRLPGKEAPLPEQMKPQLATLVEGIPPGVHDWVYEMKYDGYRILARLDQGDVKLYTRNGHDWSDKLPHLVEQLKTFDIENAWLDGEIVVLSSEGVPSFQALQNAFDVRRTKDIVYYLFDLPYIAGRDIRDEPLTVRRDLLKQVLERYDCSHLRLSEAFDQPIADLVSSACKLGLEGFIGKRPSAPYVQRRSDDWVKLKCGRRQEFVIVGFTAPKGERVGFGALLLAVHEQDGNLRYAGKVGTGFNDQLLQSLHAQLSARVQENSAVTAGQVPRARDIQWVKPDLVAEVSFAEWTNGGHVRHATFKGLRTDKSATAITREDAVPADELESAKNTKSKTRKSQSGTNPDSKSSSKKRATVSTEGRGRGKASLKLSNPGRVIDPSSGFTKLDLARYYAQVAPLMLEHLKGRPVSFVRAPAGITGEHFFQKHSETDIPGVTALPKRLDPGHASLMEVASAEGLLAAAQLNVVEFHTWNGVKTAIAKPDRMIFDLDSGEGVDWPELQRGASLVRVLLEEIGLQSWLKTSGGKGLHVVVPVRRQYDWDTVKAFSAAIVRHLARTLPQLFVAKSGPRNRVGKIFADYLRNGFGATTVAAWSARARPGMGVSVPVTWDELEALTSSSQWTIANIEERLGVGNSPWDDYTPQGLTQAMKKMKFDPSALG